MNDAFWNWFGNSMVVDIHNRPRVVYHGTPSGTSSQFAPAFTIFDLQAANKSDRFDRIGFWFDSDRRIAEKFGRNMHECYLSIQNPLIFEATHDESPEHIMADVADLKEWDDLRKSEAHIPPHLNKRGQKLAKYYFYSDESRFWKQEPFVKLRQLFRKVTKHDTRDQVGAAVFRQWMEAHGYDGILMRNSLADTGFERGKREYAPRDVWIAMYPNQIKSVTNDGTWDKDDSDIRSNPMPCEVHTLERMLARRVEDVPDILFHRTGKKSALWNAEHGVLAGRPDISLSESPTLFAAGHIVYVVNSKAVLALGLKLWPYIWGRESREAEWTVAAPDSQVEDIGRGATHIITSAVTIPLRGDIIEYLGWHDRIGPPDRRVIEQAETAGIKVIGNFDWEEWWDDQVGRPKRRS